jgi:DNA-binding MarR family transcriptional regulator
MDCACFNTRKVARLLGQIYDRALEPSGLKNTQFTALAVANRVGPISITELARSLEIERTSLTRNLQVLQRDGLIKLGAGVDQRSKTVVVTKKGRRRLEAALPLWAAAQERVLHDFGGKRWQSLRTELDAMRATLHA